QKDVLGIWIEQTEGAKFWLKVMNELKNRGVQDVLIAVVDGLKGFPEAIHTVFPQAQVQTCIVHMVRHSLDYCSYKDRKAVAADLKTIYRAETETMAQARLAEFVPTRCGRGKGSTAAMEWLPGREQSNGMIRVSTGDQGHLERMQGRRKFDRWMQTKELQWPRVRILEQRSGRPSRRRSRRNHRQSRQSQSLDNSKPCCGGRTGRPSSRSARRCIGKPTACEAPCQAPSRRSRA